MSRGRMRRSIVVAGVQLRVAELRASIGLAWSRLNGWKLVSIAVLFPMAAAFVMVLVVRGIGGEAEAEMPVRTGPPLAPGEVYVVDPATGAIVGTEQE